MTNGEQPPLPRALSCFPCGKTMHRQELLELQRDVDGPGFFVHFHASFCLMKVLEEAVFFDALQEVIRIVAVIRLARL